MEYPCVFMVLDRIVSTEPDFKKTWLLHSIQEPDVNGKIITIVMDEKEYDGKMIVESLLPDDVNIARIGGPGREFWIESAQTNYTAEPRNEDSEPGAWRIEISPAVKNKSDIFLHVLFVMDDNTSSAPEVHKIDSDHLAGAKALDIVVLFSKSGQLLKNAEFKIDGKDTTKILVCDLSPGRWSVKHDNSEIGKHQVLKEGKCLYFKGSPGAYSMRHIQQ
jgi:hypothetical protein